MLDGKYEITSERELSARSTLFSATAPDGTALQITWFELQTPDDERAFERYRALLRTLRRQERAAVYDLVARPGAYYVAWHLPADARTASLENADTPADALNDLRETLTTYGRRLDEAEVYAEPSGNLSIYMLPFEQLGSLEGVVGSKAAPTSIPQRAGNPPVTLPNATLPDGSLRGSPYREWWRGLWQTLRPSLLGITLALGGCLLLLLSFYRYVQTELVVVPEVRGEEVNHAAERLHALGFGVSTVALVSEGGAGRVLELAPPAGTPLRPGRTLSVRYALPAGGDPQRVPDVRQTTLAEAERALEAQGFNAGEVARVHADAALGTVISQTPAPEVLVPGGSGVALLVSDGPKSETTFLPDLSDLTLDDALAVAELAGFTADAVQLERVGGTGRPAGTVLAQNLPPLVSVPQHGARLRLTVAGEGASAPLSSGGVPDLTGLTLTEAQRRARSAGVRAQPETQVSTLELPEGVVLQRPGAGSPHAEVIYLTLNVYPQPLPRPDVRATLYRGEVRRARYAWLLEGGIPSQRATVTARTLSGETEVVLREQRVSGGEQLSGIWLTTDPGPITFSLTLNGLPYSEPVTVNP